MDMYNHRTRQSILVGIPVAFFSEMRAALSVLGDQNSSLGLAISASLLPPAGEYQQLGTIQFEAVPLTNAHSSQCWYIDRRRLHEMINGKTLNSIPVTFSIAVLSAIAPTLAIWHSCY